MRSERSFSYLFLVCNDSSVQGVQSAVTVNHHHLYRLHSRVRLKIFRFPRGLVSKLRLPILGNVLSRFLQNLMNYPDEGKKKTVQFINSELLELPVSLNGNLARRKVSVCEDMVAPPPDQAPHYTLPHPACHHRRIKVVVEINDANEILCIFCT